jgi:hypothetical protein
MNLIELERELALAFYRSNVLSAEEAEGHAALAVTIVKNMLKEIES